MDITGSQSDTYTTVTFEDINKEMFFYQLSNQRQPKYGSLH